MSKAKHTQGKWEVSPCNEHDDLHYICAIPNNIVVARTCYATQSEANARLIAASPELVEALKGLLSWSAHLPFAADDKVEFARDIIKKIEQ